MKNSKFLIYHSMRRLYRLYKDLLVIIVKENLEIYKKLQHMYVILLKVFIVITVLNQKKHLKKLKKKMY